MSELSMVERRVLRLRACRPDHLEACKQGRWGALEGGVQDRARLAWLWPPCPYDRDNPNSVLVNVWQKHITARCDQDVD